MPHDPANHRPACRGRCGGHSDAMDRRRFLSAAAAASVTLALVACGDHQIGGVTGPLPGGPTGGSTITVRLADFAALATVGGVARVTSTGTPIAVHRSAANTFEAFAMGCPHAGTTVSITATGFTCPNHNAKFGKDGAWLSGQRTTALVAIPVTYDAAAGTLTLAAPAAGPGGGGDDDDDDDLRVP